MRMSKAMEKAVLGLAGEGKPKRVRAARPPKKLAAGWAVELTLPTVVYSTLNAREHWASRKRKADAQHDTLRAVLYEAGFNPWHPPFPVAVTWTHLGRKMDTDNLAGAFKALRDSLSRWMGVDDGDEASVTWVYEQDNTGGTPGVRVRVQNRD